MRLLNVDTHELEEFFDDQVPRYVILSHRWGKQEVSYRDWQKRAKRVPRGEGYDKIHNFCNFIRKTTDFRWAWIDTCCIDKTSSAELSEAINSMFRWYQRSAVCHAYLADVDSTKQDTPERFRQSEWFLRGWTLQELLAPTIVVFHDVHWQVLGHKCPNRWDQEEGEYRCQEDQNVFGAPLNPILTQITKIEEECLGLYPRLREKSIALLMSWAAERRTTRVEDLSYCLMGLFDLNFPPLYGEGDKAFLRLQEELVQRYNDPSIFFWTGDTDILPQDNQLVIRPMFASQPSDFAFGVESPVLPRWNSTTSFRVSNRGIEWTSMMTVYRIPDTDRKLFVIDFADLLPDASDVSDTMGSEAGDIEPLMLPPEKIVLCEWGRERLERVHQLPADVSLDTCQAETPAIRSVIIRSRIGQNYRVYTGFPKADPELYALLPMSAPLPG